MNAVSQSQVQPSLDGRAFIDGKRVVSQTGAVFDCVSPVDGRILTQVARCGESDIDAAVSAATGGL